MKATVKKLWSLALAIEKEKGQEFILFALTLPEDAIAWDLMMAAKWIDNDQQQALRYLVERVQQVLTKAELRALSGVLLFKSANFKLLSSDMPIERMREKLNVESVNRKDNFSFPEVVNDDFFGKKVREAYVFAKPAEDIAVVASR